MNNTPLVSICTTTYNREKYIAQAIESCMSQITTFEYDMVISDNNSTDKTLAIIEEYQNKFPGKITLLKADKNYGLMINYIKSIEAGTGKYIADCDGDDYWIDSYKLQKQVDFLESNPDFVMCFTNTYIRNEATGEQKVAKLNVWDVCNTEQLIEHNSIEGPKYGEVINTPGHVSSIVFRNNVFKFPEWYKDCYINDEPLFLMLSKYGKAKFINEFCTVYRTTNTGISTHNFSFERDYKGRIDIYKKINKYHSFKYNQILKDLISMYYLKLMKKQIYNRKYFSSIISLINALFLKPTNISKLNEKIISK